MFDELALNTYELTLPEEAWELLQRNARDEEYTEADLSAGGTRLARVGLRFKGSLGTLASCFADDGTRTCDKLSMKLKFDEYLPEQQFHGLKRLVFNSMNWDLSQLRERLAYKLFREMGVIAPRAVHARLVVNGEYLGLFSLVEDVDGRFTDDRFIGGDGNLYKEQWPDTEDPDLLSVQLETNKMAPDHSVLQQFHSELDAAYPGAYGDAVPTGNLPAVVARYMDIDHLFAYLAVHRTINDWDGVTAFYCVDGQCYNHNYYLYQHEAEPRFTLIPWDLDNTFDLSGPLDDVEGMFEIPADCSVRRPAFGRTVMPPACDPLFRGLALSNRARYVAALDRLLGGPFVLDKMESWIEAWQAQLEDAVSDDTNGPGLSEFQAEVEALRDNLSVLRERAIADRDSQP